MSLALFDIFANSLILVIATSHLFLLLCMGCPNAIPSAVAKKLQTTGSFIRKIIAIPANTSVASTVIARNSIEVICRIDIEDLPRCFCLRFAVITSSNSLEEVKNFHVIIMKLFYTEDRSMEQNICSPVSVLSAK